MRSGVRVFGQLRPLHLPPAGDGHQIVVCPVVDRRHGDHPVSLGQVDEIGERPAAGASRFERELRQGKRVHRARGGHGHQVVSSATEKRATREIADPPLESLRTRESGTGPSRKGFHIPQSTDEDEHGPGGTAGGKGELAPFQDLGAATIGVQRHELGQLTPQVALTLRSVLDELP